VLVLERTTEFRDRIRGEVLVPWGYAEAKRLGLDRALEPLSNALRRWDVVLNGATVFQRDVPSTCLPGLPVLTYYHPAAQQAVLDAATSAGATVLRGARVTSVEPGETPRVTFRHEGKERSVRTRVVAGADGRGSSVRSWCGFEARRERERRLFAGLLFENMKAPEDVLYSAFLLG
jgi:2-polyprenyl-6-methoxyphenol hydroxylase-like FAD-dependent oxidoreductase